MAGEALFTTNGPDMAIVILLLLGVTTFVRVKRGSRLPIFLGGLLFSFAQAFFSMLEPIMSSSALNGLGIDYENAVYWVCFLEHLFGNLSILCMGHYLVGELADRRREQRRHILGMILVVGFVVSTLFLFVVKGKGLETRAYAYSYLLFYFLLLVLLLIERKPEKNRGWFALAILIAVAGVAGELNSGRTGMSCNGAALAYLTIFFNYQMKMENELLERELELSEAKVSLLTQQISPHFIFNSLQAILNYCDREPERVKPALSHFSKWLRSNLESLTASEWITFEKELENVREYILLEKDNAGKDFEVEYRLGVTDFKIPPLVLQPIVENAVRYGIGTRSKGGLVVIETLDEPYRTVIRVTDDGSGRDSRTPQQKDRQSIGMKNVRARLHALCDGSLTMEHGENGTTVTIVLPKN